MLLKFGTINSENNLKCRWKNNWWSRLTNVWTNTPLVCVYSRLSFCIYTPVFTCVFPYLVCNVICCSQQDKFQHCTNWLMTTFVFLSCLTKRESLKSENNYSSWLNIYQRYTLFVLLQRHPNVHWECTFVFDLPVTGFKMKQNQLKFMSVQNTSKFILLKVVAPAEHQQQIGRQWKALHDHPLGLNVQYRVRNVLKKFDSRQRKAAW